MAAALLAGAPLLWSACTDTWDEHYNVTPGGMADQPSLLENIAADPSLANFYKVVQGIEGADLLASPQQFTVWAPKSLTAAQADSVIAVYKADLAEGKKWEDNRAVTQFLQNHMALYTRPVSALTVDTVTMRNTKYMSLIGTSNKSGTINGHVFDDMVLSNNGILYKMNDVLPFFPNVRQFTENNAQMTGLTKFFKEYDEYELDEEASTPGGVQDGKVIYLDSVSTLYNRIINRYGLIEREDSLYACVAPTDEVWDREYEQYSQYFIYNQNVNHADSLADINTKDFIMKGRFFNISPRWRYNLHPQDSLCNTNYSERQEHNPRMNVYYKPEQNLLAGLAKYECSNGFVYVDNKGVIDPHTTFFGRHDIDAYSPMYYELPKDKSNIPTMNAFNRTYEVYETQKVESGEYDEDGNPIYVDQETNRLKKRYNYVNVTAKTASAQTEIEYKVDRTLSNVYYNVYIVTCPDRSNPLPTWFSVQQSVQNEKGVFGGKAYFNNPHPVTEGSCADSDVILKQGNNQRCFVASGEKVDTILVQTAVKYDYSGYGVDDGVVKLHISSFGPSGSSYREKIYTRSLRLNEIILIPFNSKEEAEAAADDIDAFSDEKLQALKEN